MSGGRIMGLPATRATELQLIWQRLRPTARVRSTASHLRPCVLRSRSYFRRMVWSDWLRDKLTRKEAEHLRRGRLGEKAAKRYLKRAGLKFLVANFKTKRGEIDLVFRDDDCLVFVEVKTRSSEDWARPAAAVDAGKKRRLSKAALEYLRKLDNRRVKFRFDIVEVLWGEGRAREIRHLPNAFALAKPYRHH